MRRDAEGPDCVPHADELDRDVRIAGLVGEIQACIPGRVLGNGAALAVARVGPLYRCAELAGPEAGPVHEADAADHAREAASGVRPAAEPEDGDAVARPELPDEPVVALFDAVREAGAGESSAQYVHRVPGDPDALDVQRLRMTRWRDDRRMEPAHVAVLCDVLPGSVAAHDKMPQPVSPSGRYPPQGGSSALIRACGSPVQVQSRQSAIFRQRWMTTGRRRTAGAAGSARGWHTRPR